MRPGRAADGRPRPERVREPLLPPARTCDRCHQDSRHVDFKQIAHKGTDFSYMASKGRDVSHLVGTTDYIGFKALGYKGDPIIHGGRFKKLPMGYKAEK